MTAMLLAAAASGRDRVATRRASEFFGPGATLDPGSASGPRNALADRRAGFIGSPGRPHSYSCVPAINDRAAGRWHLPGPLALTMRVLLDLVACRGLGVTRSRSAPASLPAQSCASWNRSTAVPRTRRAVTLIVAAGKARIRAAGRVRVTGPGDGGFVGRACACPRWLPSMTATARGYRP
jgi:hypothetical protein